MRLPEDPADWLLEHSGEEFLGLLSGATSILEYGIRRATEGARGANAISRARALPEIRELIGRVDDPVLGREALRLAAEALGVSPETLREELRRQPEPSDGTDSSPPRRKPQYAPSDPYIEAGRELLGLVLARPDLAARPLREGIIAPTFLDQPIFLEPEDFGDETQARIFALLAEHAGEGLEGFFSDDRVRPLLDEISALRAAEKRLYPSEASLRAAWFRLAALSREKKKSMTDDFDEKFRLLAEIKCLNMAAVEASNLTLES